MNCDQVFQHLTSVRPAPQNGALSRHLDQCPACRQMAELFEPVVQLLAPEPIESQAMPNESRDRWSQVCSSASVAERAAEQLEQHGSAQKWRARTAGLLRMAAVLLAGIVLGVVCTQANSESLLHQANTAAPIPKTDSVHHRECRYDDLLAQLIESGSVQFCATCRPKLTAELSGAIAMCMVCHTRTPG